MISFLERRFGVHFAMGGTGSLVNGLVKLIGSQGGDIRYGAEVSEITLDGRRATGVRLASGEILKADVVVSNADVAWTYRYLLPKSARRTWTDKRLDKARYSMSLFVWYFGTNKKYDDVPHHTILLGPRYRELLDDIFENKRLAADFSLYLHRPTATDPSLAPAGNDAFYVLSPVPHLEGDTEWTTEASPTGSALPSIFPKQFCGLRGSSRHLAHYDTPRLPRPPEFLQGRRVQPGARAHSERLVPSVA